MTGKARKCNTEAEFHNRDVKYTSWYAVAMAAYLTEIDTNIMKTSEVNYFQCKEFYQSLGCNDGDITVQ